MLTIRICTAISPVGLRVDARVAAFHLACDFAPLRIRLARIGCCEVITVGAARNDACAICTLAIFPSFDGGCAVNIRTAAVRGAVIFATVSAQMLVALALLRHTLARFAFAAGPSLDLLAACTAMRTAVIDAVRLAGLVVNVLTGLTFYGLVWMRRRGLARSIPAFL